MDGGQGIPDGPGGNNNVAARSRKGGRPVNQTTTLSAHGARPSRRAFARTGLPTNNNQNKERKHNDMAIKMIGNYAKRLGLPGYSSHQFSVSVETELTDLGQVQGEATRLYGLLQDAVDREIQHSGFIPGETGRHGHGGPQPDGTRPGPSKDARWNCSDKQKEFILKLVDEHGLDRGEIEQLAIERFGHGVKSVNKLEASGLIDEILETRCGGNRRANGNGNRNGHSNGRYRSKPEGGRA